MSSPNRRVTALLLSLMLAAGLAACGNRAREDTGNAGQEPQTPGVTEGQNPAQEADREDE